IRMAMIAMTTRSSISVKPARERNERIETPKRTGTTERSLQFDRRDLVIAGFDGGSQAGGVGVGVAVAEAVGGLLGLALAAEAGDLALGGGGLGGARPGDGDQVVAGRGAVVAAEAAQAEVALGVHLAVGPHRPDVGDRVLG